MLHHTLWRRLQALLNPRYRRRIVVVLLLAGLVVSSLSARSLADLEQTRREQLLDTNVATATSRIDRLTARAVDALESVRPLWLDGQPTDARFKAYLEAGPSDPGGSGGTTNNYAGLTDLAFIRNVQPEDVRAFEREVRQEGRFAVDLDGTNPAYVIQHHSADAILGVDVYPLDDRREALERARDIGQPVTSPWYVTVSDLELPAEQQREITLLTVPVYEGARTPATIAQRRQRLVGWLATPLYAGTVSEQMSAGLPVTVELLDGPDGKQLAEVDAGQVAISRTVAHDVLQQTWYMRVGVPRGAIDNPLLGSTALFVVGLCLTALLTLLYWMTSRLGALSESRATTATARLRERDEYVRVLAERVLVGIADFDVDGQVLWANSKLADLTGRPLDELIGTPWVDLVHPEDRDTVAQAHRDAMNGGGSYHCRHRLCSQHGERWVELAGAPTQGTDGAAARVIAVVNDVSAVVEFEEQLRSARDRAVEASRLKSEFLANMSHEIRTPLNGVIGMADVLYRSDLTDAQRSKLSTLRTAATQLRDLLSDILDLSKIEAGRLELDDVEFDPTETIALLASFFASEAFDRGLTVRLDLHDDMPRRVRGAELRLRQVLNNLIGNAVKFTEQGEIALTVQVAERAAGRTTLAFTVSDTGIGISPERIDAVFDPFVQADASDTRAYGGSGLGLAISRQLVHMMGGELQAASSVGAGSTFRFSVAFEDLTNDEQAGERDEHTGAGARTPRDAPPARLAANDPARPATHDTTEREGGHDVATARQGSRVLIVEDNPINQEVARELLVSLGYDVEVVDDGRQGVDEALTGAYDAVLMDCQMPMMDGYEATARIREHEAALGKHTPIIALTAAAMVGDRQRCLAAGMDDYVSKPVNVEVLAEALQRWINSTPAVTADPGVVTPADDDNAVPVVDWQILHQLSIVPGLLERSRNKFLDNAPAEIANMRDLHSAAAYTDLRAAAHKMKGASLTLGAKRLGGVLQRVEDFAVDDPEHVTAMIHEVETHFDELREALLAAENA